MSDQDQTCPSGMIGTSIAPTAPIGPGSSIAGRYEVVARLGGGGMGEVFSARRIALGDTVAIKLLHPGQVSAEHRARFLIEARAAARIRHPNVIEVYDFGEVEGGTPFIVMQHLEGVTLAQVIAQSAPLPVARTVEILAPVCAAVEAGHRRGVVHRDLKPANIVLATADDGREMVKVLDFGLALVDDPEAVKVTIAGSILGTPRYMSPEQVMSAPVGPPSDVFSLGILLYEMVTGTVPFTGSTPMAVMIAISQGRFVAADQLRPELPRALVEAIDAALAVDPGRRPATPGELLRRVEAATVSRSNWASSSHPAFAVAEAAALVDRREIVVGRAAELARLREEARPQRTGRGRTVVVEGPAGIGATTLVRHFASQLEAAGATVLEVELAGSDDDGLAGFASLADALGVAGGDDPTRLGKGLAAALGANASGAQTVVVLHDLHRATAAVVEVVANLANGLKQPAMLVATCRNPADPRVAGTALDAWLAAAAARRELIRLLLGPFDRSTVRAWLDASFPGLRIHPSDVAALATASSGNPFFLSEIVAELMGAGKLSWHDGWRCGRVEHAPVSEAVRALLDARCAALPPALLAVLEVAAAVGSTCPFLCLAAVAGLSEDELDAQLAEAVRRQLLSADGDSFRFREEPFRQVLYQRLPHRRRVRLHRSLADEVERPGRLPTAVKWAELTRHHHAAGEWEATLTAGLEALRLAAQDGDPNVTAHLVGLARAAATELTAAGTPPERRLVAELDLVTGAHQLRLGLLEVARGSLGRAVELATRAGCEPVVAAATLELAGCQMALGSMDLALATARAAQASAARCADLHRQAEARLCEITVLSRLGRSSEALEAATELVDRLSPDAPPRLRSLTRRQRAWDLIKTGAYDAAEREAQLALDIARSEGDQLAEYMAVTALAAVRGESEDDSSAVDLHLRSLELSRLLALRRREAIDLANLGEALYGLGRTGEAVEHFRSSLDIFVEIGDRACEGDCRVNLGRALLAAGEQTAALETLRRGRALCEATGRLEYAAIALLAEGDAHLALGDGDGAREAFGGARALLERQRSHLTWRADLGLARAEQALGLTAQALDSARAAAARVEAQLARLPAGSDTTGFRRSTSGVWRLIEELERPA